MTLLVFGRVGNIRLGSEQTSVPRGFPCFRGGRTFELLEARLDRLSDEIATLHEQQRIIVRLLANPKKLRRARAIDKDRWVAILRAAGLDDAAMHRWHVEFERAAAAAHEDFLESLGLSKADVASIRRWSSAKG